jgi:hypothetical protein
VLQSGNGYGLFLLALVLSLSLCVCHKSCVRKLSACCLYGWQ